MLQNRPTPFYARRPWYRHAVQPAEHSQPDEHRSEDGPGGSGESRFRPHTGRWTYDSSTVSSSERGQCSSLWSSGTPKWDVDEWSSRSSRPCWEHSGRGNFQEKSSLNEQAAHAMSEHKSAQIHVQSQDQRIKELNAELHQAQSTAGLMNTSFQKTSSDLSAARSQFSQRITYKNQIDALNQQIMDMQKSADLHRKDFEREIEKLRQEQKDLIRHLKPQPLEGTPGLHSNYQPGIGPPRLLTISPSGSGWWWWSEERTIIRSR